jgi:hypothetical protein
VLLEGNSISNSSHNIIAFMQTCTILYIEGTGY